MDQDPRLNGLSSPAMDSEEDKFFDIDLRRILAAVRRNIIPAAIIVVGVVALGAILTLLMVPQYVATSRVLVEQQAEQILEDSTMPAQAAYQDADRFLQTQLDVIRSRSLAERVVEANGLDDRGEFFEALGAEIPTAESLSEAGLPSDQLDAVRKDSAIALIQESTSVALPVDSRLVAISFESANPTLSAELANSVAENFIEANLARKFDSSAYARQFLGQQLEDARTKLEESERELNSYSRAAGLIRITGQGANADTETTLSVTNDTLVQLNAAASAATAERIAAENRWRNVSGVAVTSIPQVLQNPAIQSLLRQRSEVESALAEERARHLADHPNVQALQAQTAEINREIQTVGNSIKNSVKLEYESALDRENAIRSRVGDVRSDALNEQDRGVQYNILKREAETDRALYNTLLTRYNELSATAGATSNNITLVDLANIPREADSPNLKLNLLLALIAGVALAGGFIFMREQFDDVMRDPDDVERKLGLSLLGLIPRVTDGTPEEELEDAKSPISEAYRSLVTNLRYSTSHGIPSSMAVTSSQSSEGKTTTSNRLASEFAQLGKRTLLVDADLRRPTLHRRTNQRERDGLTSLLAGERTIEEVIFASDIPNLSYMTALPIAPDPAALLRTDAFANLVEKLTSQFDCVIFDAPPVLGLSDAPMIAAHVEATIMVIDSTAGGRGSSKASVRRLRMVGANIMGAVLTKFDPKAGNGSYSYYGADYYTYETRKED
ncbi:GumC family protein [Qipengyuania zhejiangensis]|uniref:GumC family protein n=1 Tax=Qipengyuania zhejiangensis TaxID=3077782 RepID=UPI002D796FC5|nr:polysaccharide biosynthesis tyrosine autokinase [Qipengyuania sp. Z2]